MRSRLRFPSKRIHGIFVSFHEILFLIIQFVPFAVDSLNLVFWDTIDFDRRRCGVGIKMTEVRFQVDDRDDVVISRS